MDDPLRRHCTLLSLLDFASERVAFDLSLSSIAGANVEGGVHDALDVPIRRHCTLLSSLEFASDDMSPSDELATNSKTWSLDPVEPASMILSRPNE